MVVGPQAVETVICPQKQHRKKDLALTWKEAGWEGHGLVPWLTLNPYTEQPVRQALASFLTFILH